LDNQDGRGWGDDHAVHNDTVVHNGHRYEHRLRTLTFGPAPPTGQAVLRVGVSLLGRRSEHVRRRVVLDGDQRTVGGMSVQRRGTVAHHERKERRDGEPARAKAEPS
jgi:hypothetical protein